MSGWRADRAEPPRREWTNSSLGRVTVTALGVFLIVLGTTSPTDLGSKPGRIALLALLIVAGLVVITSVWVARLWVEDDRLVARNFYGTRSLPLADVVRAEPSAQPFLGIAIQALTLLPLCLTLAACGDDLAAARDPASHTYDGPLHLDPKDARHPKAGAAGNVVDCDTWGRGGSETAKVYAEGATARTPAKALEVARGERPLDLLIDGNRVAKQEKDRVLYVIEVEGVVKQAMIMKNGPATKGAGGDGWYVESWARCDDTEMPRSWTDAWGLQIWTDATGKPIPTTKLAAWVGDCLGQAITVNGRPEQTYVRKPQAGMEKHFTGPARSHVAVPDDAVDTGYVREGDHLWVARDRRYAYVGQRDDAAAWPRTIKPMGCA